MSTSSANSGDRSGQAARSLSYTKIEGLKIEGLLNALSSVPNFPFANATSHPVDRKSDDQARHAAASPLEIAGDRDVKRSQTTICIPPNERQIHQTHGNKLPPGDLSAARVVPPRGDVDLGMPTPRLRRPGYDVKKLLVASAIAAMVGGSLVFEILILVQDSDFPGLPKFASPAPSLPKAASPSTEVRAIINLSEPERITQAVSLQPAASLRLSEHSENQPVEKGTEVTLSPMVPGAEYEKIVGKTAAAPGSSSIATPVLTPIATLEPRSVAEPEPASTATPRLIVRPESTPIARLEPAPESLPINQASPHIGKTVAADRTGFLFADSNVRFLTRAELRELSADRLHIARNEIFARRGRYFKDDSLRAYFSQFPWYQPHAWDVPLSLVEQANVGLIQSIEAPAAASRGITAPVPAHPKVESGAAFADSNRPYLTPQALQGLSAEQLAIIRNEIFARRGRYFKDYWLRAYFSQFWWYQPHAWDVPLSPVEQGDVKLVQSFEQTASTSRQPSTAWRVPPM